MSKVTSKPTAKGESTYKVINGSVVKGVGAARIEVAAPGVIDLTDEEAVDLVTRGYVQAIAVEPVKPLTPAEQKAADAKAKADADAKAKADADADAKALAEAAAAEAAKPAGQ